MLCLLLFTRYHIDSGVRSKELPTLILFVDGVEKLRRPLPDENEVMWYYRFTKVCSRVLFELTYYHVLSFIWPFDGALKYANASELEAFTFFLIISISITH